MTAIEVYGFSGETRQAVRSVLKTSEIPARKKAVFGTGLALRGAVPTRRACVLGGGWDRERKKQGALWSKERVMNVQRQEGLRARSDGTRARDLDAELGIVTLAGCQDWECEPKCLTSAKQHFKASPEHPRARTSRWFWFAKNIRTLTRMQPRDRQRGSATVTVAGSLTGVLTMAALVIDGGQLFVTAAELQTVADLAAESAAREVARVYMDEGREDPLSDTLSGAELLRVAAAANERAEKNSAGGTKISVAPEDVRIGKWDDATGAFVETNVGVDAVQVKARRDETSNGMVQALFSGIIGREGFPVRAEAAARISGIRYLPAGTADFPVAIAKAWYSSHASPCSTDNTLTFHPTGTPQGCVGWHTFEEAPASGSELKAILNGLRTGTYTSPEIDVQKTQFIFSGGTVTSAISELQQLYNAKKNANGEMPVLIPVYDRNDCSNPNGWIRIIGVARAVITKVETGGNKRIEARVQCDVIEFAESGGPDFGTLAAGPDLVR